MSPRLMRQSILFLLLLAASPLAAATWRVELDGSGNFTDIQPAVEAAAAGDTILIGPGRFANFHPIGMPGYNDEVIVLVTKPNLTFIGSGKNVTRVGPAFNYLPTGRSPRAFFSVAPNSFALRNLTAENVKMLVFSNVFLDIENCSLTARDPRIWCITLYDAPVRVQSCDFTLAGAHGVALNGPSSGAEVRDCQFSGTGDSNPINCSFGPRNVSVSGCTITNGGCVYYDATGSIANCSFVNQISTAIYVDTATSDLTITDVSIEGAECGIATLGSHVAAVRLTITNTTIASIVTSERSYLTIHNSNLLPNLGLAVYCNVSSGWPAHTLDLTNNNWGVTNSAAIDAMIWDHRDDPSNPCTVLYDPYVGQPVSVETTSWGDLKASYR